MWGDILEGWCVSGQEVKLDECVENGYPRWKILNTRVRVLKDNI